MHSNNLYGLLLLVALSAINQWVKRRKTQKAKPARPIPETGVKRPVEQAPRSAASVKSSEATRNASVTQATPRPGSALPKPEPRSAPVVDEETPWEEDAAGLEADREEGEHPGQWRQDTGSAPGQGKDLLTQLAKQLGLEIPAPPAPAPRPAPTPAPSVSDSPFSPPRSGNTPAKPKLSNTPVTPAPFGARKPFIPAETESLSAPPMAPMQSPSAAVPVSPAAAFSRAELSDPAALQRAFILKTILDAPVSMRPPGHSAHP